MLAYVLFGGMIATTWVQIIKAVLLLFGVTRADRAGARAVRLLARRSCTRAVAERYGQAALEPGGLVTDPVDAVSLGLALMLGLLGLPHILMRFYTVPDARAARTSVLYATGFIGYFYLIIPIVGFGASALVGRDADRQDRRRRQHGGAARRRAARRHAVPRLHRRRRLRHDPRRRRRPDAGRRQRAVARHLRARRPARPGHRARAGPGRARWRRSSSALLAVLLGILFKGQNVAFMVGLAFAIACSANFPPLLLSIVWRRFTTAGAVCSIVTGAVLSVAADRPEPDRLGRPAAQSGGDLPAAQPGDRLDADGVPRRHRRRRCSTREPTRRSDVRRREAADVSGRRRGVAAGHARSGTRDISRAHVKARRQGPRQGLSRNSTATSWRAAPAFFHVT